MNPAKNNPIDDPKLKGLVQEAIWIVREFGYWRWSPVPLQIRTGIYPKKLLCNFMFDWNNVRIQAFGKIPIPESTSSNLIQDELPNMIVSVRREKKLRFFGIPLFRYHFFQEVFIHDLSGEFRRLRIPENGDLDDLISAIHELHDALKMLIVKSGMSAEQLRKIPNKTLNKLMKASAVESFQSLLRQ